MKANIAALLDPHNFLGSGLSDIEIARRFSKRRNLSPRKLAHTVSYVRRLARHGNADAPIAERLAWICGCDARVFLNGVAHYSKVASGATGTRPTTLERVGNVTAHAADNRTFQRRSRPSATTLRVLDKRHFRGTYD